MKVNYPDGSIHYIDIDKVSRLKVDGTYLIEGTEHGRNVVLHFQEKDGKFTKVPHNSVNYGMLQSPLYKKEDVTSSIKPRLENQVIDTLYGNRSLLSTFVPAMFAGRKKEQEKKEPYSYDAKATVEVFLKGEKYGKYGKYITKAAAYNLGMERGLTKERFHKILDSPIHFILGFPSHRLTDQEFNYIEKNFGIKYIDQRTDREIEEVMETEPVYKTKTTEPVYTKETTEPVYKTETHNTTEYNNTNTVYDNIPSFSEETFNQILKDVKSMIERSTISGKRIAGGIPIFTMFIEKRAKEIAKLGRNDRTDKLWNVQYHDILDMRRFIEGKGSPLIIKLSLMQKKNSIVDYLKSININPSRVEYILNSQIDSIDEKVKRQENIEFIDIMEYERILDGVVKIATMERKDQIESKLNDYLIDKDYVEVKMTPTEMWDMFAFNITGSDSDFYSKEHSSKRRR